MNWHEVRLDEVFATPWKNGGGSTRELLAWPHRDNWTVRASIADVEANGPFSEFAGVTRWFAVLSGEGVKLHMSAQEHALRAGSAPLRFDGGANVDCELMGGATQDFNLMLRGCEGKLEHANGRNERTCRKGSLVGVYSHDHEVAFRAVEVRVVIPPRTLAWSIVPTNERVDFATQGALWFEVQP
ncbi:MAG TPA: HutD family protein [Ramlibacter sp.]|nr:HutD family protein [Ramlibacter sp.]